MASTALTPPSGTASRTRIGTWEVDPARNELRRGAETARLEPKVIEVLLKLAERPGEVFSREELLSSVWPGVVVGDDALTQAIIKLRRALGDDAHRPTYIETISKRGYRLVAPVGPVEPVTASPAALPGPMPGAGDVPRKRRAPIAAAVAVALVLLMGALTIPHAGKSIRMPWPLGADTRGAVSGTMPVVAVLPLANLSGDPKRDYFSDGVTEDIITALGRSSGLRVMSLNAVQQFKGKALPLNTLQAELGARYIVKGSVRESEGRMRVAVELSDAEKGELLWSERFDGASAELFEIQDRIVRSLVSALHVKLTELERQRVFTRPTESLEAHDLVLRARALLGQLDRRANREGRVLLARARELAPGYAEILTAQGVAELHRGLYGWVEDPPASLARAEELGRQALTSPDTRTHASAHVLLSAIYSNTNRVEEALKHAELALAANPSDSNALYRKGSSLLFLGRAEDALAAIEAAHRVDPTVGDNSSNLAHAYYQLQRYADTVALADAMLARTPEHITLQALRTAALAQLGRAEEAKKSADRIRQLSPGFQVANFGRRFADPQYLARIQEGLRKAGLE